MLFPTLNWYGLVRATKGAVRYISSPSTMPTSSVVVHCANVRNIYTIWFSMSSSVNGASNIITNTVGRAVLFVCYEEQIAQSTFENLVRNPYGEHGLVVGDWYDASYGILMPPTGVSVEYFLPNGHIVKLEKLLADRTRVSWWRFDTAEMAIPVHVSRHLETARGGTIGDDNHLMIVNAGMANTISSISQQIQNLCPVWGIETTTTTTTEQETEMSNEEEEILDVQCTRNSNITASGTHDELLDDGWMEIDGNWYSEDYWFSCEDCNDSYSTHDLSDHTPCGEQICDSCASNYSVCRECDEIIRDYDDSVELFRPRRGGWMTYHECCAPEHHYCESQDTTVEGDEDDCQRCNGRGVMSYSTKFDDLCGLRFHNNGNHIARAKTGVIYLGLEHEMLNETRDRDAMVESFYDSIENEYAILKEDASIGYQGFEYVSQPMTLESHRNFNKFWDWLAECKRNGFIAWDAKDNDDKLKCGIHIHLSRSGFTNRAHTARFILAVYKFQDELVKFSGRRSKRWADYAEYERMQFIDRAKGESNPERYVAVNVQNEHTIELRIFRSSMVPETVTAYLELADALAEWTRVLSCRDHYDGKFEFAQFREWLNDKPQYSQCADRIDRRVTRVITEV